MLGLKLNSPQTTPDISKLLILIILKCKKKKWSQWFMKTGSVNIAKSRTSLSGMNVSSAENKELIMPESYLLSNRCQLSINLKKNFIFNKFKKMKKI